MNMIWQPFRNSFNPFRLEQQQSTADDPNPQTVQPKYKIQCIRRSTLESEPARSAIESGRVSAREFAQASDQNELSIFHIRSYTYNVHMRTHASIFIFGVR